MRVVWSWGDARRALPQAKIFHAVGVKIPVPVMIHTPKAFDNLARRGTPGDQNANFDSTLKGWINPSTSFLFHPFRVMNILGHCGPGVTTPG